MCIGRNVKNGKFEYDNLFLENSEEEEVALGVTIDNNLIFDSSLENICRKADLKLAALLKFKSKTFIFSVVIKSQLWE